MKKILFIFLILNLSILGFGQYSKVVTIGDSLTAGFQSGGLVETHQVNSFPAMIAGQVGVGDFQQPLISEPGIPALLTLMGLLNEYGVVSPTLAPITEDPAEFGYPVNLTLERPYDNLGVPGAILNDALNTVTDGGGMHDIVLRGLGTQVQQALSLQPDLLIVWIGNNDALGAALMGTAVPGVTLTPKDAFAALYGQLLETLVANSTADIVLGNIPDVTAVPFVTTIPPYIVDPSTGQLVLDQDGHPIHFLGQNDGGGLFVEDGTYILLTATEYLAQGYGIPATMGGTGLPLPDHVVLTPPETALIQEYIADFNNTIASLGASHGIPVVDFNSNFHTIAMEGLEVAGMEFTTDLITGGLFSYDGFHLNTIGYAFVANYFIDLINANYGAMIEPVRLTDYFFTGSCCPGAQTSLVKVNNLESFISVFTRHFRTIKEHRQVR